MKVDEQSVESEVASSGGESNEATDPGPSEPATAEGTVTDPDPVEGKPEEMRRTTCTTGTRRTSLCPWTASV